MNGFHLSSQNKRLAEKILQLEPNPSTFLDIGCGKGEMIKYLKATSSIQVYGIDEVEENVNQLMSDGMAVEVSDARKLPFEDGFFDWALISNVLHHIPNPKAAVSEALRVSSCGVLVCEPWYDTSIECQRLTAELDEWNKKVHHALGYYHRKGLNAGEIINLLTGAKIRHVEVFYEVQLEPLNIQDWFADQAKYIQQLPEQHVALWEKKQLEAKMQGKSLCKPGWLMVTLYKSTGFPE